jgi:hypothetical protein
MPKIEKNGDREFIITTSIALLQNSLCIFRLSRDGKDDITWAFQTAKKFSITSCFPGNAATNVPKNSGIEITFSSAGYTPIDGYFSISPHVEGRFEYHKSTAVFVPKSLDYKTVYTVTIKAGIKLEGTNDVLLEDYDFAFETEAETEDTPARHAESIYFFSKYEELPTIEAPRVGLYTYNPRGASLPNMNVEVYRFGSVEKAIEAIELLGSAPYWSRYAKNNVLTATNGLSKIMSFNARDNYDGDKSFLTLPDKLSQGFYLIEAKVGANRDQMVVQISDLPVQVIGDNDKAIFWVNDIGTGKASAGATVYDAKEGKKYVTDSEGIAVIDRMVGARNTGEQFAITSTNGKTCVWLYTQNYSRYFGSDAADANEAYWTTLQLDRDLFQRDDTVSFFGFAQNRESSKSISNVVAVLTAGYRYGNFAARDVLHRQVVPIKNCVYSDEIKLPNLDSGPYCLTVYNGDIALASTYFTVREYVKPPYKIDVAADKAAAFAGETVTFTAKAGFFEGTPVADLDVSYRLSLPSYYTNSMASNKGEAKTDINGKVEVSEKIMPESGAQGQAGLAFSIEATLPEMGLTTKRTSVRVFINDIEVASRASLKDGNATLIVNVDSITLDRINNGTAKHYNDYLDAPVANKAISVEVYRVYYEKVALGDYYDYIEKKVRDRKSVV